MKNKTYYSFGAIILAVLAVLLPFSLAQSADVTLTTYEELELFGKEAVLPIKITNTQNNLQTYTAQVEGVTNWGTYRFEPASTVVLSPNEEQTIYLLLRADNPDAVGLQRFKLIVDNQKEKRQIEMAAHVLKPLAISRIEMLKTAMYLTITVLAIILIAMVTIVGIRKLNPQEPVQEKKQMKKNQNMDDFDLFDDAESDKVVKKQNFDDEFY